MFPSTSLTPPREDQLVPLYPSNCWISVLNLIEPGPAGAIDFWLLLPAGILKWVTESTITCFPAFGWIIKSWTWVEIVLSSSFSSWPITKGQFLKGPIWTSSASLNVIGPTASCDQVSWAVPLFCAPLVCVGSLPTVAVVPSEVTSYKLFLYLMYCPVVTGVFAAQTVYAGIPNFTEDNSFTAWNSKDDRVNLTVLTESL